MRFYLTKREKQDLDAAFDVHMYVVNSDYASQEQKEQSKLEIAKILGHSMSPLFPTGMTRNVLMAACMAFGIAGFFVSYWWLGLFIPVALAFSPRIAGELCYLAGQFQRGYHENIQSR